MVHTHLKRKLLARHIMMIALSGSIGTGLFLASGNAIYSAGPGGAVLTYALMGVIIYFLMTSLGEMATLMPSTGTFCDYSARFVDPAFGFAMGYNYFFNWAITVASELTAAAILMQYWFPHTLISLWEAGFLCLISLFNIFNVRVYGETEYWLSFIKISAIVIFIAVGFLLIFGTLGNQGRVGFENWTLNNGPFHGGTLGVLTAFLMVGLSFQGTELVGVTAGEVKDPRTSVPKAIRNIFWRILVFYILSIIIVSFLIPYTNPNLINASMTSVAMSPFTMVFSQAGLKIASSVVNFIIVTAVLSACNASMYTATRTLWYLGKTGHAPKAFAQVSSKGVPVKALLVTILFGMCALLTLFFNVAAVYTWLVTISGLAGFIAWFGIAVSHYRFRKSYLLQGNKLEDLPYRAKFYPFGPILSAVLCVTIIFGQIFTFSLNFINFFQNYTEVIIIILFGVGYKVAKKSKLTVLRNTQIFESKDFLPGTVIDDIFVK